MTGDGANKAGLLALHSTLGSDSEPLVDGRPWQSAPVTEAVETVAGDLLGHESVATTEIYTHVSPARQRSAVQLLEK